MSNMSYCRFENTYRDLIDVSRHINDDDISASEHGYKTKIIKLCKEIAEENRDDGDDIE